MAQVTFLLSQALVSHGCKRANFGARNQTRPKELPNVYALFRFFAFEYEVHKMEPSLFQYSPEHKSSVREHRLETKHSTYNMLMVEQQGQISRSG